MKLPQYEVKTYDKGFEDKILELFPIAYQGRNFPMESWLWRFCKNPCLNKRITTLWDGNKLVAHNGLTPFYATFDKKNIVAANSGTTMAREEYLGVSIQLFQECDKQNQDIEVIYGFPNKNSFRITTKYAHHIYLGDIAFWECDARKELETSEIKPIDRFNKEHGELYLGIADNHQFMINRTKDYLNWRFIENPSTYKPYELVIDGKIVGYIVVNQYEENGQKQLQIIDVIANSLSNTETLLRFAINLAYENNCQIAKLWLTSDKYKDVLIKLGFKLGDHVFPMTSWRQNIDIGQSYITMADSDVF